jgi:phenylacetate-coenzyme A ligase PaaK-like adenylate-forming protein
MLAIDEILRESELLHTTNDLDLFQTSIFNELTQLHLQNCSPYRKIVQSFFGKYESAACLEQIPYLPIGLFKVIDLISVPNSSILRMLKSSGTSGNTSRIFLDKITAINQLKVLVKIFNQTIGTEKMPMVIIDMKKSVNSDGIINTRLAAVKGFSVFASEKYYVLDENLEIQIDLLQELADKYGESKVLFFGFTFLIWQNLINKLESQGIVFKFPNAIMVHGGGWKKLSNQSVSTEVFKQRVNDVLGINKVLNYYGMAEQTGSIYFECLESNFHTTPFGQIIIRNFKDFSPNKVGEEGIVQLLSVVPRSYPGHSILTEDVGVVIGNNGCKCGNSGRFFKILGRLPEAEIRGCSDVYGND